MNTITHSQRYLPHEFKTRYYAVMLYRTGVGVAFVCRRYHISKSSLMRWNKRYDGTKESLRDKSHRPHSSHPNAHTAEELAWIRNYFRRNPNISVCELYGKLLTAKGYTRHPASLYRVCRRMGYFNHTPAKKKTYKPKPYDTPSRLGMKWQDEASRQRFLYPYMEQSSYSTVDFVKRAIAYFEYQPKIIQTDNGAEFTHLTKTEREHPLDSLCRQLGIFHKRIRPRTPRHNGKVERSHRNDQERFYNHMSFYDYFDLATQMKQCLRCSNNIPMQVLGWKTPLQKRLELER